MQVKNDYAEANSVATDINAKTDYFFHDNISFKDEKTTITALTRMRQMYENEQIVTQLVCDDMKKEGNNLIGIAGELNQVDLLLSKLDSTL